MSKISHSNVRAIFLWGVGIIVFAGTVVTVFVLIFNRQPSITLIVPLLSLVGTIVISFISLGVTVYQSKKIREQEKLFREQMKDSETQTTASPSSQLSSSERNEEVLKLYHQEQEKLKLLLLQQRLELDKQRLDLQKEQQTVEWQREALTLTTISPRSAIMIAWLGIEQELQRLINQKNSPIQASTDRVRPPSQIITVLRSEDYINEETFDILKNMQNARNKIAHGFNGEEISAEDAMRFVQQAILIEKTLSAKQIFNKTTTE